MWIVKFTLLDSSGSDLSHETTGGISGLRRLEAGTYYIKAAVNRKLTSGYQGPYNIQAMTIPDPGDTFESAASLNLMADDPPVIRVNIDFQQGDFHTPDDVDFFKVELSADAEVMIKFRFPVIWIFPQLGLWVKAVNVDAFDEAGNPLHPPIPGFTATRPGRGYSLEAGTYYFRLSLNPKEMEKWGIPPNRTAYYSLQLVENVEYAQFIDDCSSVETDFDDPLLGCQGHLPDVNVKDVWATNKGEGINIAVVDKTMDSAHADLRDNVNETLNHDYTEEDHIFRGRDSHGTAVAGVIAARDNDLGVRGVAPRATIYNYNYLEHPTLANLVDAITRNKSVTAISNNSYGWRSQGGPIFSPQVWNLALETGVREGFDGKGTFYVFAVGNSHMFGNHVNLNEGKNFYAQTTVCVVDSEGERVDYSETGYTLWICAPHAAVTADHRSRYRYDFSGTSSAAPVVSGVAALVRSANPSLTWRDVKLLLAASARQNDPANSGWEEGALEYGSETVRYSYNPEYGFGVVDAKAAVDQAESWTNLPPMETARVRSGDMELAIPDPSGGAAPTTVSSRLTLGPEVGFTEFVEVHIHFDHQAFRDLEVELHSPTGTVSKLAVPDEGAPDRELRTTFRFGSARHLGEDPSGEWTLKVTDHLAGAAGSIRWWGIKVYGHGEGAGTQQTANSPASGAPDISGSVRVGATLSADVSGLDDWNGLSDGAFSHQWIRNDLTTATDTDIPGATEATYTLVAEDEGHAVKVRVTFTDDDGYLETITSSATKAVGPRGICDRTKQVRKAILFAIRGVSNCSRVSAEHLDHVLGLELTGSGITALQAGDFHDLPNVNELRLGRNDLESLPEGVFDGLDGLRKLYLNDNNLSDLPDGVFDRLRSLRRLYLNDNDLSDLPDGAFGQLESLRRLRLNDNDLSELPDGIFDGLTDLRELWLHSNPGAPFTLTVELERRSDTAVVVRVAQGAPFDIEATLSVTGGELSVPTLMTVSISGGSAISDEIPVMPDGDGPVTVSVSSAALQLKRDQTARGIQVRTGDPLTLTEGDGGNTPATGAPTITGTVQVGEALTADTSGITDADGLSNVQYEYQWMAADAEIAGATGLTYTLVAADEGKAIKVRISFTDDAGNEEELTSEATGAVVARPNNPATGEPTINGTAQVGETLTADTSDIADEDGLDNATFSYQWLADDAEITGATNPTYTLADTDRSKAIKVRVSFTDDAGNEETLTSAATAAVAGPKVTQSVCDRTRQVRDSILAQLPGVSDCGSVTDADLGGVTELRLTGQYISVLKAGDFSGLANLQRLYLDFNNLAELPEDVFDGLSNLEYLDLGVNGLRRLPSDVFDGLSGLEQLYLNDNRLGELPEDVFDGLFNLWGLWLTFNDLSELPEDVFDDLSNLDRLSLSRNDLSELPEDVFGGLANLKWLNLRYNDLIVLPDNVFGGLAKLEYLNLWGNLLPALPEDMFDGLTNLRELHLSPALTPTPADGICNRTPEVIDAILPRIPGVSDCSEVTDSHLSSITDLDFPLFESGRLKDGDFRGLSNVRLLRLAGKGLVKVDSGAFDGLPNLEELHLYDNSLWKLPEDVFDGLSNLELLWLSDNDLKGLPSGVFDGLSNLEYLNLNYNRYPQREFELPEDVFDGLSSLETLLMDDNGVSALPAAWFDDLSNLSVLSLQENRLTTLSDDVFDNLTQLESLDLSDNGLTTLSVDWFDSLIKLERLNLGYNDLDLEAVPEDFFHTFPGLNWLGLDGIGKERPGGGTGAMTTLSYDWLDPDAFPNLRDLSLSSNDPERTSR